MKTWTPRAAEIERNWYVVDAEGQTLGRLATKIATALLGKAKPTYADHMDTGDFVIVINAAKLVVTGDRLLSKRYHSHSGHPGGHREEALGDLIQRKPTEAIRRAVKGMLPKT
ncbi:MAG: 50S ribosomal protein L13, partial [Candidatus Limnocylindrus sp.]